MGEERQRDAGRDMMGLALFGLGTVPAVMLVLWMRAADPEAISGFGPTIATAIADVTGAWPGLVGCIGLALLGGAVFVSQSEFSVGRHIVGLVGLTFGLSLLLGGLTTGGGGAIGGGIASALPESWGGVATATLGAILLGVTLWVVWLPSPEGFSEKAGELSPIAAAVRKEEWDGVSPAEAAALIPSTPRGAEPQPSSAGTRKVLEVTAAAPAAEQRPRPAVGGATPLVQTDDGSSAESAVASPAVQQRDAEAARRTAESARANLAPPGTRPLEREKSRADVAPSEAPSAEGLTANPPGTKPLVRPLAEGGPRHAQPMERPIWELSDEGPEEPTEEAEAAAPMAPRAPLEFDQPATIAEELEAALPAEPHPSDMSAVLASEAPTAEVPEVAPAIFESLDVEPVAEAELPAEPHVEPVVFEQVEATAQPIAPSPAVAPEAEEPIAAPLAEAATPEVVAEQAPVAAVEPELSIQGSASFDQADLFADDDGDLDDLYDAIEGEDEFSEGPSLFDEQVSLELGEEPEVVASVASAPVVEDEAEYEDEEDEGEEEYEDEEELEEEGELEEELEDDEEYEEEDAEGEEELEDDEEYEDEEAELEEDEDEEELEDDEEYEEEEGELEEEEDELEDEEGEFEEEDDELEEEEDELESEEEDDEEFEEAAEAEEDETAETEPEVVLQPAKAPAEEPRADSPAPPPASDTVADGRVFEAGILILERGRVAVSLLQREFNIDFDQATALLDELQVHGLIGPYIGGRTREILLSPEQWAAKAPAAG